MSHDFLVHFFLEAVGAAIGVYAYNFCRHRWHQVAVWLLLTALTTAITVEVVG